MFRNAPGSLEDAISCDGSSFEPKDVERKDINFAEPEVQPSWTAEVATEGTLGFHQCHQIHIELDNLDRFTVVTDQFADIGVTFHNAIAIKPSNPVYPTHSGERVLIGAPSSGWLSATFHQPVAWVGAYVTGSRSVLMSAFDATDRLLTKIELPGANLDNGENEVPPNSPMLLQAEGIASIRVHCVGGQFTLDDFSYSM
ncbi:MAG: hypothetical protein AAF215_24470 [Cyanobacteria bacterium P01_A01_bin.123]